MPSNRRRFLTALAATGSIALAGCPSDETTPTATLTPSTTVVAPTETTSVPGPMPRTTTTTPTPTTTETPTTPAVDIEALRAESQRYARLLADQQFQTVIEDFAYTDQVATQLDAATLEQLWASQTAGLGTFSGIDGTEYTTRQGFHIFIVTAVFSGGQQRVRLVFDGQSRIAGLQFPQSEASWSAPDYADRSAFTETEISMQATDACELGGTLTLPTGEDTVPAVVLVHGSGPSDRDSTIGPNKPFKDLAWGLASRGVAVYRYDKRTAACQIDGSTFTIDDETTEDALTAVQRVREHERVDSVVVAGHSLGGMVAPRIATRAESLAGIVMLAAPAREFPTLLLAQTRYLAERDGTVTDSEQAQLEQTRQAVERIRTLNLPEGEAVFGAQRPYWESLQNYDHVETAQQLSLPRLLLQGGRDYQITVEDDFQVWQDALSGQASVSFELYPQLNHLFIAGSGQASPEEYYQPGNVDVAVVEDIAAWVSA